MKLPLFKKKKNVESISEQKFYAIAETAADSIIITDENSVILYANHKTEEVFGYSLNELKGHSLSVLLINKYWEQYEKGVETFLNKFLNTRIEIEAQTTAGEVLPVELSISGWEENGERFFTTIIRDISERKNLLEQLEMLQAVSQAINESEDFSSALKITIQKCCEALHWDYGEVWLPDEKKEKIFFELAWNGKEGDKVNEFIEKSKSIRVPLSGGMAAMVYGGEIFWNPDLADPKYQFSRRKDASAAGFKACLGVPVKTEEEVVLSFLFFSSNPKQKDDKTVNVIASVARQIGAVLQRKKIEAELKESEYFIKKVADSTPSHIYVFDYLNKRNVYSNKEILDFLGYPADVINEKGLALLPTIIHQEDLGKVAERQKLYETGSDDDIFYLEYRVKNYSNEWRWHAAWTRIFKRTSEGKLWQVLGIAQDITDRKNAEFQLHNLNQYLQEKNTELAIIEEQLKEANQKLESRVEERTRELKEQQNFLKGIIEQSPISTWISDNKGTMILVNDAALRLYGVQEASQGIGKYNLFKDETIRGFWEEISKVFSEGEIVKFTLDYNVSEVNHVDIPTGVPITIITTIFPIRNTEGEITNAVVQAEDITKRVFAEREKEKYNKELIKINNDLDNFIYTASHDLKAPVSNIEGLIHALKESFTEKEASTDQAHILGMVEKSISKFKETIQDLTEISKVQKNLQYDTEEVDINNVIDDVVTTVNDLIKVSDGCLDINIDECRTIKFSKASIKSVFYNLISNALKYRAPERAPKILIRSYKVDNYAVFEIKDNGLGLKKEYLEKLFKMFKRFHTHVEGTGIGLYIVKRIVENSGGKIEVESEEGVGTTFRIYFLIE